ncbi:hypothetical protein A8C56_01340 [Niabella ginsenosidivorans]|uniref:Uncharacterized protein n=1 Tax=Niabella ginsenosidivorans TaxID=1176587 RepID=A0A1A9I7S0_9BACT|nr:hypothetical protein [Niabella ginsenosidivorans]ANH83633.1 hypothetical protein A8C56_01340 [Niabella ginsenosidivorans]
MYTQKEEAFIKYWEAHRLKKKRSLKNILISTPLGIILVIGIFVNFFSGWYKRAAMEANADPSLFLVLLVAGIIIVAFVGIFSSYHKWDINENYYKELLARKDKK